MSPQNIFYIVASITLIIFLGLFAWVSIIFVKTLQSVKHIVDEIQDLTQNLSIVKEGMKVGILTFLSRLLGEGKEG